MSSNSKRLAWRGMDEKSAQVSEGIDMWKHEIIPIELQRRRNASRWWLAGGAVLIALAWAVGMIVCAAVGSTSSRMGASGQIEELPPFIAGMLSGIVASFVVREVLRGEWMRRAWRTSIPRCSRPTARPSCWRRLSSS